MKLVMKLHWYDMHVIDANFSDPNVKVKKESLKTAFRQKDEMKLYLISI